MAEPPSTAPFHCPFPGCKRKYLELWSECAFCLVSLSLLVVAIWMVAVFLLAFMSHCHLPVCLPQNFAPMCGPRRGVRLGREGTVQS